MAACRKLYKMSDTLHFPVSISKLPPASDKMSLPVDEQSCAKVAEACGVLSFSKLDAKFRFKRWRKHGVMVSCDFSAEVEQQCISTLEPINTRLNESFERQFLPEHSSDYKMPEIIDGEMILDPEADLPDIIEGDTINLWDILIEELILVIDPFPRAADAEEENGFELEPAVNDVSEPTHKPFSDLKALITEKKSNN